jgi:SRSO17 transposase
VLADAGHGNDSNFRAALTKMELTYAMGVQSTVTVWKPSAEPKPAPVRQASTGRPDKLLQRDAKHQPVSVKELTASLPAEAWKKVTWRLGSEAETPLAFCSSAGASSASRLVARRASEEWLRVPRARCGSLVLSSGKWSTGFE